MGEEIKPMVKDFQFVAHWNFGKEAQRVDKGEIVWPGNIIHGKSLVRVIDTKKRGGEWGKGEARYMLDEEGAPEFDSPEAFIKHYTPKDEPISNPPLPILVKVKPNAQKKNNH